MLEYKNKLEFRNLYDQSELSLTVHCSLDGIWLAPCSRNALEIDPSSVFYLAT